MPVVTLNNFYSISVHDLQALGGAKVKIDLLVSLLRCVQISKCESELQNLVWLKTFNECINFFGCSWIYFKS